MTPNADSGGRYRPVYVAALKLRDLIGELRDGGHLDGAIHPDVLNEIDDLLAVEELPPPGSPWCFALDDRCRRACEDECRHMEALAPNASSVTP